MAQVSYGTITITDITDIESIKNWYLATNSSSGVTKNTSGWTDTIQQMDANKQYLWNYEQILGTGNVEISSTQPTIIGHYGVNGQTGAEGNSIVSIDEYYQITNSTTNPGSSGWTKNGLVVPTSTNRYLWNYQVINYSKTTAEGSYADARIIGVYGDTGQRGSSILKVTTAPTSTSGTAGGFSYSYRMSLSTVKTQSGKSEVLIGDIVEYNSNHYSVGYVNSSYVYLSAATSIKGADGQTYYTHILYSSKASPTSSSDVSSSPTGKSYVGIQTITSSTAPAWNDSGWVWMKYIGTDGAPGPQGVSVTGVKEIYYLKTSSGSVPTAPADGTNITSTSTSAGVWTTAVPKYISGAKYYTSIQTLLSSGTSPIYSPARLNSGLTDANQNALDAYNTSTARDTEVNALKAQAKHYWWDNQGAHVAAGNNTTSVDNITQGTPSTYGFNSLMAPGYLMLKYKDINFVQLATNSLTFYRPATDGSTYVQGKKGMDLTSNALTFYKPLAYNSSSEPTAAAQLGSNGLILSEGGIESGSKNTTDYIYIYSHDDATNHTLNINSSGNKSDWRIVAGKNFGVDKGGNLYASNVNISGLISAAEGTIGGFTIGSDNIHHTKTSYSETTNNGIWLGTDGIGLGKGLFYVTNTGSLTAKSGTIGGITIGSNYLTTDSSRTTYDATTSGLTITPSGIGAGNGSTNTFKVDASTGALTAGNATLTGGSIAGWSFNTTSLYKNNAIPGAASNAMVISTGTSSSNSIGGSTGSQSWMLSAGTGFGVTTNGVLYATGASIYGSLYASKGYIGGWQIGTDGNKSLHNGNANTSPTPGEGVIILSKGITGPLTATGVLPANQNWTITAGNQFGVTTEGTMYASGAILKSVTLKDSYNRTRAAIDVNGLHIYDTNGYLKADFGNSINLYGGSSSEGDYPKVTLDASLGIYLYGTGTSYSRINSDGLTITQNGVDLGFFGTQLVNDIAIPRAIVGSQDGASYILLQQDGMYMYGADTSKGPIMAVTQGTNYIETGGLAENFEIEPKFLDESLHKYADENAQSATYYGNTDFTSNPTKAVIKVGEYDSDVIKATYTIPLTYNSSTQVCSGTTSNCTVSYNVTYKTCTVTLEAGITTYLHNYSSSWLFEYNPLTDNTSVAKGATSATVNFLSTIKSGTSFSITDGEIMPTNLATFTAGTSATKTYTITQDLGESSSNITVTAVYNGAKRIQFTFSSALVDTYYFKFKDVQMYGVQIKGAAVYATSNLPDVSFTFGKREGDAGSYSTIIGRELIASRNDQTVVGRFNVSADGAFIVGNGSYNASTLTRSNACVIDWKGNMSLSGRLNIPNNSCKVLWTGGYYMSQGHIARFAAGERVSTQNHGIVLVWSAYENSAVKDYDWYYQFIPKWHVIAHAGQGVDCIMMNNAIASGVVCKKYVYIYDDRITGNSKNTAVGEGYANNTKVLRAVLGV